MTIKIKYKKKPDVATIASLKVNAAFLVNDDLGIKVSYFKDNKTAPAVYWPKTGLVQNITMCNDTLVNPVELIKIEVITK